MSVVCCGSATGSADVLHFYKIQRYKTNGPWGHVRGPSPNLKTLKTKESQIIYF